MTEPTHIDEDRVEVVQLKGRAIKVQYLNEAQLLQIMHESRLLKREDIPLERKTKGMARLFANIKSMIVEPDDVEFVEDLISERELGLKDLVVFAQAFRDEEDAPVAPKVRRGRAPARRN